MTDNDWPSHGHKHIIRPPEILNCLECHFALLLPSSDGAEMYKCLHSERPDDPTFVGNGYGRPEWCKKSINLTEDD